MSNRWTAAQRLHALAAVFEEVSNYSAADCCREWADLIECEEKLGARMAQAMAAEVSSDGS